MDDKHSHIDDWMRRAAAQQPAPDDAGEELKRQAWSKMADLLDEDEAARPKLRLVRFRLRWAAILIPFIGGSAVFAATIWLAPHFSGKTQQGEQSSIAKERRYINITQQSTPADTITAFADTTAAPASEGGVPAYAGQDAPLTEATNPAPHGPDMSGSTVNDPAAGNNTSRNGGSNKNQGDVNSATASDVAAANSNKPSPQSLAIKGNKPGTISPAGPKAEGSGISSAIASKGTSTTAGKKTVPHNKVNKAIISGTINDNEAVADERTITPKRSADVPAGRALFGTGQAVLRPVRARNVFALQLPALSAATRDQHVPVSHAAGNGITMGHPDSRWALQAGLLSPLNSALGVRIGLLYRYPLGSSWSLQPQVSAGYLTGYDRSFTHVSISKQRQDTGLGSVGQDHFDVDTITTPYTLKRAIAGSVGINLGYHKNKMTVSTGLVYSLAMPSGRKDSTSKRSGVVRDSLGTPYIGPAFSTGKLPGSQQLSWNIDLSWYLLPQLQAGFNYRVALWRSKGDKGFQAPLQKVQDNSMLELYIRIPIGR